MTSEEVKELLRQLSKDTQEIGDVRSRTVRIRLGGEEEPKAPEEAGASEETADPDGYEEPEKRESEPDRLPPAGNSGRKTDGKRRRSFPKTGPQKEAQEDPGDVSREEPEGHSAETEGEDGLVTRYMDDEEREAYLAEKADAKAAGKKGVRGRGENGKAARRGRGRKKSGRTPQTGEASGADRPERAKAKPGSGLKEKVGAFVDRQRRTPVEPAAFEEDAWMFRSGEAEGTGTDAYDSGNPEEGMAGSPTEDERDPLKEKSREVLGFLESKGIGLKQLAVIGSIIVLAMLILAIILTLVGNRRKSERVEADEGLRVIVEKEPSKWCRSGEVTLRIDADSPIQSVSMNSQPLSFTGQGRVTAVFTAEENPVNLMVVSEDKVRTASVGFARIDGVDPVVSISSQDGTVSLEAADDGSGVDKIWYGMLEGLSEVPAYQEYTGPFEPEKGRMYSYFATDRAGNASEPVTTNLTPAESISLNRDEVSVFAGETYELELTVAPEKAFLNNLAWISSDETVATVSSDGVVTALKDGEAVITARADGVADADCTIRVRSEVSVTISAVGDVTLGEDASFSTMNNFTAVYTMNGPAYFLQNVRNIFEADDITFANHEGTLTDQGTREPKEYAFRGDPSYVQVLTEGSVEAVTLANNHSHDYGEVSHTDTQKYLEEAGIAWCDGDDIILQDVSGVRMALIGIYVLAEGRAKDEQVKSCIARAKEEGAQLIVVAFHWGNELESQPDETQRYLGRLAVDCGADLVVGHHPHVLQGIEKYSGKYICYSLGNFCFGGNSNPTDKDTMIFQQTFRILRGGSVEDGGVSVIPCSISSTSDWNNYQPTPASGPEAERIMARINKLCEPFKTSF